MCFHIVGHLRKWMTVISYQNIYREKVFMMCDQVLSRLSFDVRGHILLMIGVTFWFLSLIQWPNFLRSILIFRKVGQNRHREGSKIALYINLNIGKSIISMDLDHLKRFDIRFFNPTGSTMLSGTQMMKNNSESVYRTYRVHYERWRKRFGLCLYIRFRRYHLIGHTILRSVYNWIQCSRVCHLERALGVHLTIPRVGYACCYVKVLIDLTKSVIEDGFVRQNRRISPCMGSPVPFLRSKLGKKSLFWLTFLIAKIQLFAQISPSLLYRKVSYLVKIDTFVKQKSTDIECLRKIIGS